MMHIVVPFGFYGWGNIGDEATLHGFAQLLAQTGTRAWVSVASRNPAHTAWVEPTFRYFNDSARDPRRWLANLRATARAFVGGTPIMDIEGDWPLCAVMPIVRSVDRWKTPLAFIGVGTETLRLDRSRRMVADEIAPRVRHWSVRCEHDRQRLAEYGVPGEVVTVAADMAWLIEPASREFGREHLGRHGINRERPLIGVNLVNENRRFDRHPEMVLALAAALDGLAEQMDALVVFLANEVREDPTFDKAAALQVIARMARTDRVVLLPNDYLSPRQMMSVISCCDLTISMRYHFCLFSVLQGIPFIAIERSDKVADLCWDIDWPARVPQSQLEPLEIVEYGTRLCRNAADTREELKQCVTKMKKRALRNLTAVNALLENQPMAIGEGLVGKA